MELAAAESMITAFVIFLVLFIACFAFVVWTAMVVIRIVCGVVSLPFRLLCESETDTPVRQTPLPMPAPAWRMPSQEVVHVGRHCPNRLCRKPNRQGACFCSRCGTAIARETARHERDPILHGPPRLA